MKLQCEWDGCGSEYEVEAFTGFRDHVEEHLKDLLPGYCVDGCSDVLPQDFNCPWSDCGWDSPGEVHEFIRHCFFHAFHTRLKALGFLKQQEIKLPQCTLDSQTRNLVPDFPEPFVCEWESCHMEFNCPYRFFHHVDAHAMACDKTDAVGIQNSGHRAAIRVYCQWTGGWVNVTLTRVVGRKSYHIKILKFYVVKYNFILLITTKFVLLLHKIICSVSFLSFQGLESVNFIYSFYMR